jgi:hypothetical protein
MTNTTNSIIRQYDTYKTLIIRPPKRERMIACIGYISPI